IAAPTAAPTKPSSAIGVSTTRFGPKSFNKPAVILYEPSKTPISSPIRNTFSSRSSSARSVSCSACRYVITRSPDVPSAPACFFVGSAITPPPPSARPPHTPPSPGRPDAAPPGSSTVSPTRTGTGQQGQDAGSHQRTRPPAPPP